MQVRAGAGATATASPSPNPNSNPYPSPSPNPNQEAVMRFAAQPAVFGIDPAVAERCAIARLRVRVVRVRSSLQGGAPLLLRVRVGQG